MKKFAAIALVVASAAFGAAQDNTKIGLSLRAGLASPTDSQVRNVGKQWTTFGASYQIKTLTPLKNDYVGNLEFSVDYVGRGDYRSIPVLANYVGRSTGGWFYSVGAGVTFATLPGAGNESIGRFAYQAGLGYEFASIGSPAFLELKFFGSEERDLNAYAVVLGFRL